MVPSFRASSSHTLLIKAILPGKNTSQVGKLHAKGIYCSAVLETAYTWEIFYLFQALAAPFFTYLYLFYDLHNKSELKHTSSHYPIA